ncbi:MAG: hypothetical protein Q9196_003658 [Gyalolechia fulgens]
MEGFIIFDYAKQYPEARKELAQWLAEGRIQRKETIVKGGLAKAEQALVDLFHGVNTGKLLVEVLEAGFGRTGQVMVLAVPGENVLEQRYLHSDDGVMKRSLPLFAALAVAALDNGDLQQQQQQQPLTTDFSTIPLLGFGTWNLDRSNASEVVSAALQTGYRHIDCATIYGNQKEVGKGIADGLNKTGLKRSDIWVTSKLWNDHHDPALVPEALDQALTELGLEYLDLWLMHWPVASSHGTNKLDYLDAWHAMERLHQTSSSKLRRIGVSNFSPRQLHRLIASSPTRPFLHQFEAHPYLPQSDWIRTHRAHGIAVTAYSPLANTNPTYGDAADVPPPLLANPDLRAIAAARGCTAAQVALAWGMARGTAVIPKSAHRERIRENFGARGCGLGDGDLERIDGVSGRFRKRFNNPSESYGVRLFEGLEDSEPAKVGGGFWW